MEPVSLSIVVAALIAKALARAENQAVDEASGAVGRLFAVVRGRLSHGTAEDQAALAGVQAAPDSPKQVEKLVAALERQSTDDEFRGELQKLLDEARAEGVPVEKIVQTAVGFGLVQIGNVTGSSINVNFGTRPPT